MVSNDDGAVIIMSGRVDVAQPTLIDERLPQPMPIPGHAAQHAGADNLVPHRPRGQVQPVNLPGRVIRIPQRLAIPGQPGRAPAGGFMRFNNR